MKQTPSACAVGKMIQLRPHQQAAYDAAVATDRGILKMFCGTGKTRVIMRLALDGAEPLTLIVFPRIALVAQFKRDYLENAEWASLLADRSCIYICSEDEKERGFTTDRDTVCEFLGNDSDAKIVCITYQSLQLLAELLEELEMSVDLAIFDEAHHCEAEQTYELLTGGLSMDRSYFFTATPTESMEADEDEIFGPILFSYTHREAVEDDICNEFEIVCRFALPDECNIYEHMAAAYKRLPNGRILVFHSYAEANKDGRTSVVQYSGAAAHRQCAAAFHPVEPTLQAVIAKTKGKQDILEAFESTTDDRISILHNCSILGEGIDTKAANAIVFADPKSSTTQIIQNIGRATRKPVGVQRPASIIIPVVVDITKFQGVTTGEERHKVLCEEFTKGGFQAIQNVLAALRQEDEELMDTILRSPTQFTRGEVERTFTKAGYVSAGEAASIGELCGLDAGATEETVAAALGRPIEIHTQSMDTPIRSVGHGENPLKVMHADERWVKMEGGDSVVKAPRRPVKVRYDVASDLGLQWNAVSAVDEIGSAVIDCNCIDGEERAMQKAIEYYNWIQKHNVAPSKRSIDENEKRLGLWISNMRSRLRGLASGTAYPSVIKYLDTNCPGWSDYPNNEQIAMNNAIAWVNWSIINKRQPNKNNRKLREDETIEQFREEKRLCEFMAGTKKAVRGLGLSKLYPTVIKYLNEHYPTWNLIKNLEEESMKKAENCVIWYNQKSRIPVEKKDIKNDTDRYETQLARYLSNQKKALNGKGNGIVCYPKVKEYLDSNMPGWRNTWENDAVTTARLCVNFYNERKCLPSKSMTKYQGIKEETLINFINGQRQKLKNTTKPGKVYEDVIKILDDGIPGWRDVSNYEEKAMQNAIALVKWMKIKDRRPLSTANRRTCLNEQQKEENAEEAKLGTFLDGCKKGLKGQGTNKLYPSVKTYLDTHIPGWAGTDATEPIENTIVYASPRVRNTPTENPCAPTEPAKARRKSPLEVLHQRYKSMNSATYAAHIAANPQEFHDYHTIAEKHDARDPPERKVMTRLKELCTNYFPRNLKVADLGCGKNQLRSLATHCAWTSIDAVAVDPTVIVADLAALPYDDCHFQAAVLSRALWGKDHKVQLTEAYRVLNYGAPLIVCESWGRWNGAELLDDLKAAGFTIHAEPDAASDEPFQYIVAKKPALL